MSWPTMSDYQEVIQNPRICFAAPPLKEGRPALNQLGLPQPITGGFASVYKMTSGKNRWAVRCFLHNIPDLQDRYSQISRYLKPRSLTYMVGFEYLLRGIRVRGEWLPVLKMEWVDGDTLSTFVEKNLKNPKILRKLADKWLALVASLERASIGHCDLQHGNIIVNNGDLRLIDYDGMYVPSLKGRGSHEKGHPSFQHPLRDTRDHNETMDRFSSLVIYLSLLATAESPDLWRKYHNGDNLLFRSSDFVKPEEAPVFKALEQVKSPPLPELAAALRDGCKRPLSQSPRLLDLVSGKGPSAPAPSAHPPLSPPSVPPATATKPTREEWGLEWERPGRMKEQHVYKVPVFGKRRVTRRVLGIPFGKRQVSLVERYEDTVRERETSIGGHRSAITALEFSRDVRHLASASRDRTIRVWTIAAGREGSPSLEVDAPAAALAFLAERSVLAAALGKYGAILWDFGLHRKVIHLPAPDGSVLSALAVSADGRWVAAGGSGRSVFVWQTDRGDLLAGARGLGGRVQSLAFSPDGAQIACGTGNGRLEMFARSSGKPDWGVKTGFGPVARVMVSPTGTLILAIAPDGSIGTWSARDGKEIRKAGPPVSGVRAIGVSSDGRHAIFGVDSGSAKVLEPETGRELGEVPAAAGIVTAAAVSNQGRFSAIGFKNASVRLSIHR